MQRPVVQHERVIAIDPVRLARFRMDDEHAHHADRQLHHLIGMRVIHVGAVLLEREFVGVSFTGLDVRLVKAAYPIHAARQIQTMPVHGGRLAQPIGY